MDSTTTRAHHDARGVATRYDKKPENYLAGLHLRAATIWINSLLDH